MDNSLPVAYGQSDCASIVFGKSARFAEDRPLQNSVVIDALAAKILTERGMDVGMRACKRTPPMAVEYFLPEDDYTIGGTGAQSVFYDFEIDDHCEVLSEFLKLETGFGGYRAENCRRCALRTRSCTYCAKRMIAPWPSACGTSSQTACCIPALSWTRRTAPGSFAFLTVYK